MTESTEHAETLLKDQFADAIIQSTPASSPSADIREVAASRAASFRAALRFLAGLDRHPQADLGQAIAYLKDKLIVARANAGVSALPEHVAQEARHTEQIERTLDRLRAAPAARPVKR
jgi:hypothetical protein